MVLNMVLGTTLLHFLILYIHITVKNVSKYRKYTSIEFVT